MFSAFAWGMGAAGSLVIGALLASYIQIPRRVLGLVMAFGVGVLMSAISFELAEEAFTSTHQSWAVGVGLMSGALTYFVGNFLIDRAGGRAHRKQKPEDGSGTAILLGTILDGIPESIVIGLTLVHGGAISVAMVAAVFLSNLPEAIGATSGLLHNKWRRVKVLGLWVAVAITSGAASWAGYAFFDTASSAVLGFTLAFAAGALITMLADTMMPDAFRDSGRLVGLMTTIGFGLAFMVSMTSN